jgi:soluble lytic murein transglycosylase-like protein
MFGKRFRLTEDPPPGHASARPLAVATVIAVLVLGTPPAAAGSEPVPPAERAPKPVRALVLKLAPVYGLDPDLVFAVIAMESAFDARLVSEKDATGLMQLVPETAARFGVADPFEPEQNLRGGMKYLRWLLATFNGDVTLTLAAYNAGEGAVLRHRGVPPYAETKTFLERIRAIYAADRHPYDPAVATPSDLGVQRPEAETVAELPGEPDQAKRSSMDD